MLDCVLALCDSKSWIMTSNHKKDLRGSQRKWKESQGLSHEDQSLPMIYLLPLQTFNDKEEEVGTLFAGRLFYDGSRDYSISLSRSWRQGWSIVCTKCLNSIQSTASSFTREIMTNWRHTVDTECRRSFDPRVWSRKLLLSRTLLWTQLSTRIDRKPSCPFPIDQECSLRFMISVWIGFKFCPWVSMLLPLLLWGLKCGINCPCLLESSSFASHESSKFLEKASPGKSEKEDSRKQTYFLSLMVSLIVSFFNFWESDSETLIACFVSRFFSWNLLRHRQSSELRDGITLVTEGHKWKKRVSKVKVLL